MRLWLEFDRRMRQWSQAELARRASVVLARRREPLLDQPQLSRYERGMAASPAHLRALAEVLRRPAEHLQKVVPASLDPEARRAEVEQEFSSKPEPEGHATARKRAAELRGAAARAADESGIPQAPDLHERIRRERGA